MADDIISIDGHVFRNAEDREKYRLFMLEEGAPILKAYQAIECPKVSACLLDLIRIAARDSIRKP